MPRVNLLPWREELRKQRQQSFLIATMGAILLGIVLVMATRATFNGKVNFQNERNNFLKSEIRILEAQIKEIETLESVKERTLARMEVIETLQRSRPEIVHLFDEVARAVPDGVHLESMRQSGTKVTIRGIAQSSTRVSAFMRNIDRSEWLTNPGLDVVQTVGRDGSDRASTFTIFATQTRPPGSVPEEE